MRHLWRKNNGIPIENITCDGPSTIRVAWVLCRVTLNDEMLCGRENNRLFLCSRISQIDRPVRSSTTETHLGLLLHNRSECTLEEVRTSSTIKRLRD
jgi:hypothetical protein